MKSSILILLSVLSICILPSCKKSQSCNLATGMNTTTITTTSATLRWTPASGQGSYTVQYRIVGSTGWTQSLVFGDTLALTGLTSASNYEWQVQTICSGGPSAFTASYTFSTSAGNTIYVTINGTAFLFGPPAATPAYGPGVNGFTNSNVTSMSGITGSDTMTVLKSGLGGGTTVFDSHAANIITLKEGPNTYQSIGQTTGTGTLTISGSSASWTFNATVYNIANAADSLILTNGRFSGSYQLNP